MQLSKLNWCGEVFGNVTDSDRHLGYSLLMGEFPCIEVLIVVVYNAPVRGELVFFNHLNVKNTV